MPSFSTKRLCAVASLVLFSSCCHAFPRDSITLDFDHKELKNFHIDSCTFNKERISVSGWAFVPNNKPHMFAPTVVYALNKDGTYTSIITKSVARPDVVAANKGVGVFGDVGFVSVESDIQPSLANVDFSKKELTISFTSEAQVKYLAKYECK